MLATIATGNVDAADIFFLVGAILGVLAGVLSLATPPIARYAMLLLGLTVGCISFGLMLL